MSELIVDLPSSLVVEHGVRFSNLLERLFGYIFLVGILVGMPFQCLFTVCFLQLIVIGSPADSEHLVVACLPRHSASQPASDKNRSAEANQPRPKTSECPH